MLRVPTGMRAIGVALAGLSKLTSAVDVHTYASVSPSGSLEPVPSSCTPPAPAVVHSTVRSAPALAVGALPLSVTLVTTAPPLVTVMGIGAVRSSAGGNMMRALNGAGAELAPGSVPSRIVGCDWGWNAVW